MVLENFCKNCGKRILPNQPYCPNCGNRTSYNDMDSEYILTIPIHNIGFFNFDIDFSPYINNIRRNFKYEICGCGFLNEKSNDFCPMCGTKRRGWRNFRTVFSERNLYRKLGTGISRKRKDQALVLGME